MADFKQAVKWLREGKKVRLKDLWKNDTEVYFFEDEDEGTLEFNPTFDELGHLRPATFMLEYFEATDWEIYAETKDEVSFDVRTGTERVAYLVGKYFTRGITLKFLKLQINAIEEPETISTTTS